MSTIPKGQRRTPSPETNRFFYGWRDVVKKGKDGRRRRVQIPLTAEDVLHPQEGDHVENNSAHWEDCGYLLNAFTAELGESAVILSNSGVQGDDVRLRHHAPDISVILGVKKRKPWLLFDVAEEGVRPILLMEVTSPATRQLDRVTKRRQDYQAKVPFYVILDELPESGEYGPRLLRILGYRRGHRGYKRLPLNDQGRLWLEPVGVWLGIEDGRAVCDKPGARRLGTYTEVTQALRAAEERVRQLEEELRRRNGGRR